MIVSSRALGGAWQGAAAYISPGSTGVLFPSLFLLVKISKAVKCLVAFCSSRYILFPYFTHSDTFVP